MAQNKLTTEFRMTAAAASAGLVAMFGASAANAAAPAKPAIACPPPAHHVVRHHPKPHPRPVVAPAPVVAPPAPPVAAVAPPPPPPPQPQGPGYQQLEPGGPMLGPVYYDLSRPLELPMAHVADTSLTVKESAALDKGDCNHKGFWDAIKHPINARCLAVEIDHTTTQFGIERRIVSNDDNNGKIVYIPVGETVPSASISYRTYSGKGWGEFALQMVSVGFQGASVAIASEGLHIQQNLNNQIINGIHGGKFNSLFGSFGGCGNTTVVNGTVQGNANANCMAFSNATGSNVGQDNNLSGNGNTGTINSSYGNGASLGSPSP